MSFRKSPNHELEIVIRFHYSNFFKPNEHREDYHIRKQNDINFRFKIEDRKYIFVGENSVSFETNDELVKFSSELGFNDIKLPFACSEENIYITFHRKYITFEYKNSTQKNEYEYLHKKDDEYKLIKLQMKTKAFLIMVKIL